MGIWTGREEEGFRNNIQTPRYEILSMELTGYWNNGTNSLIRVVYTGTVKQVSCRLIVFGPDMFYT
jgi:Txe/YoeB family toxin of Txe-Axe toxin-antitoxin module